MVIDRRSLLACGAMAMTGPARANPAAVRTLYDGKLFADYHQVYLRDESHSELPNDYSPEAIARRLMVGSYGLILHTARNMDVPIRVEWHSQAPTLDLNSFQHVVEAAFGCPTGRLVLAGLTDYEPTAQRLNVPAGVLGVRACLTGLDTLSADGLEGSDRYLLQLWPSNPGTGVRVLKAWPT